jgi:SAM-dependent methyltransferase
MSEFETFGQNYSERELKAFAERAVEVLKNYFYAKLVESAGNRKIESQKIEALAKYWAISNAQFLDILIPDWIKEGVDITLSTLKAVTGTDEELVRYFSYHFDKRDAGLKEYSTYLGEDIEKFINERTAQNKKKEVKILDIGCAEGLFLEQVRQKYGDKVSVWGLAPMYEGAEAKNGVNFKLGLMELMPEEFDSKFDLVTTLDAVMYSADPELAFDQSVRSLNENGVLLFACGAKYPACSGVAIGILLNITQTAYEKDFNKRHHNFYKKMALVLPKKTFTLDNREFEIVKIQPSEESWTPVVYKVTRIK